LEKQAKVLCLVLETVTQYGERATASVTFPWSLCQSTGFDRELPQLDHDRGRMQPRVISGSPGGRVARCSPVCTSRAASVTDAVLWTHWDEGIGGKKRLLLCSGKFQLFQIERKDKSVH